MFIFMIVLFIVGYTVIALEHPLKINKSATALLLGVLLWVCFIVGGQGIIVDTSSLRDFLMLHPNSNFYDWLVHDQLYVSISEIAGILFFLIGAMTIVEMIDTQGGFKVITNKIKTTRKVKLLWIISILAFFMSAVLDNLTTSIVMVALLRKLIGDRKDRWFYASMIIIAANAGGAWSPIGDVTTIMLWVSGKITSLNIIQTTFLASLVSLLVPLIVLSFILKGTVSRPEEQKENHSGDIEVLPWQRNLFLIVGVGALVFVPIFKSLTHQPPFMGMLLGLGVMWLLSEIIYRNKSEEEKNKIQIPAILRKIDMSSILFFLGILVAVSALQAVGHLGALAGGLDKIPLQEPNKYYVITIIIGILSSIIDNVPLVAGAMGMYSFPTDHYFWEFLAYCAGTGGSILIIGSAAGVAVMGMEKIDFIWYLKKISWIALIGYMAGAGMFIGEKIIREKFADKTETKSTELKLDEESVKAYLFDNTFYFSESSQEANRKASLTFRFIHFTDKNNSYSGMNVKTLYETSSKPDSLFSYNRSSNLNIGDCQVKIVVENNDTVANVLIGGEFMRVTKDGNIYMMTPDGVLELKKVP